jgi:hypothetical protein
MRRSSGGLQRFDVAAENPLTRVHLGRERAPEQQLLVVERHEKVLVFQRSHHHLGKAEVSDLASTTTPAARRIALTLAPPSVSPVTRQEWDQPVLTFTRLPTR